MRTRGSIVVRSALSRWSPSLGTRNGPPDINAKFAGSRCTETTCVDLGPRPCGRTTKESRYARSHLSASWGVYRSRFANLAHVKQSALHHPSMRVESGLSANGIHLHQGPSCLIPTSRTSERHVTIMRYDKQVFGRPYAVMFSLEDPTHGSIIAAGELFGVSDVRKAFDAVHLQLKKRVARFLLRGLGRHEPNEPIPRSLRPAGRRCYHSSAKPDTQAATRLHDTSKAEPSNHQSRVLLSEWLEPYKDELTEQQRAGWSFREMSDWLELRGIKRNEAGLKYNFKQWGVRLSSPLERLMPYKETLIERRKAMTSYQDLCRWLQTQGVAMNDTTVERVLKQWEVFQPEPKRVQLEEELKLYKEDIIRRRKAGALISQIYKWLHEQGANIGYSTLRRRLQAWGMPVRGRGASANLESWKDTIVRMYRDGTSLDGIKNWLDTQNVGVARGTISKYLFSWGHLKQRKPRSKPNKQPIPNLDLELAPDTDTLVNKYDGKHGLDTLHSKHYLQSQDSTTDQATTAQELGKRDPPKRKQEPRITLEAYKDEVIRRYLAGSSAPRISAWLRSQGQDAGRTVVCKRLKEWGVFMGKRQPPTNVDKYTKQLIRLHHQGRTVAELQKWLDGRDCFASQGVIVRLLRKAGIPDLPFGRVFYPDPLLSARRVAQSAGKDDGSSR